MFPWQEFQTIRFEGGVALEKTANDSWRYLSSSSLLEVPSPILAHRDYGVRPVVALGIAGSSPFEMLLPSRSGRFLDIYRSELRLPLSVSFAMGAMIYHTKALARWASAHCAHFARGDGPHWESRNVFSPEEPYFEFESLLSAVVQGYEYTTIPLWKRYGTTERPPRNFTRAFERASRIPPQIRERLQRSYDTTYKRAKDYRDCIHHNVDLGSASWAMMERRHPSVWTVMIRVPDNPETKSRKAFTFVAGLDALTIGWEYVSDFFAFVDGLFGASTLSSS